LNCDVPVFKLVLSDPRSGKTKQFEIKDPIAQRFAGLKIGDVVDGSVIKEIWEIPKGFKIKITGGSGIEGAPMHPGIPGPVKKRVILEGPPGFRPTKRGERRKKLVRGNVISDSIVQINAVLVYPEDYKGDVLIPLGDREKSKESASSNQLG